MTLELSAVSLLMISAIALNDVSLLLHASSTRNSTCGKEGRLEVSRLWINGEATGAIRIIYKQDAKKFI
jgi:hypothetical protein